MTLFLELKIYHLPNASCTRIKGMIAACNKVFDLPTDKQVVDMVASAYQAEVQRKTNCQRLTDKAIKAKEDKKLAEKLTTKLKRK